MGPSEKAFQQVRNILGKLDRNIDQLRNQRTTPTSAPVKEQRDVRDVRDSRDSRDRMIGAERTVPGAAAGATAPTVARPASAFGRATPIPPSGH
ncbi:MAG: hypothetical protein U0640_01000 [Phycisphaerales bacterium]